jgi:probable rRNA maturation factor
LKVLCHQESTNISAANVSKIVTYLCQHLNINTDEIHIHFVSEERISQLHQQLFNDPSITDCITIPINSLNESVPYHILGEIFICPNVAYAYAKEHNIAEDNELLRYLIHGLLHLSGLDDQTDSEYTIMKQKENELLKLLDKKPWLHLNLSCKPKE